MPLSQQEIAPDPLPPAARGLAVVSSQATAPAPPDPPHQPWLRGAASIAVLERDRDPSLPARRRRAPFLFRHPRRPRLEQLLVLRGVIFPFAMGPAPLPQERRYRAGMKLPVIPSRGRIAAKSRQAFEDVSDRDLSPAEMTALFAAAARPQQRADCEGGARPCPYVSCRHHLYLDVHPTSGAIRLNHPGVALEDMAETCALDVAAKGISSLSQIAAHLGISHERVRQIEVDASATFAASHAQINRPTGKPAAR